VLVEPGQQRGRLFWIDRRGFFHFLEKGGEAVVFCGVERTEKEESIGERLVRETVEQARQFHGGQSGLLAKRVFGQETRRLAAQGRIALHFNQRLFALRPQVPVGRTEAERSQSHLVVLVRRIEPGRFAELAFHLHAVALRKRDVRQKRVVIRSFFRARGQFTDRNIGCLAVVRAHCRAGQKNQVRRRRLAELH